MNNDKEKRIVELEQAMQASDFWLDKAKAQAVIEEHKQLKLEIIGGPGAQYDQGDAIITIFSGAGGDDAEDFSRMLFEMYQKFALRPGYLTSFIPYNSNT